MATQIMRGYEASGAHERGHRLLDRLAARWQDFLRYQRTREELFSLSERELADIGIQRCDIEGVARRVCRYG